MSGIGITSVVWIMYGSLFLGSSLLSVICSSGHGQCITGVGLGCSHVTCGEVTSVGLVTHVHLNMQRSLTAAGRAGRQLVCPFGVWSPV